MQTVKTPQINMQQLAAARAAVDSHPCAFRVIEGTQHLTVICPLGYQVDGVRVSMANGKTWAYEQALVRLEKVWKQEIHV